MLKIFHSPFSPSPNVFLPQSTMKKLSNITFSPFNGVKVIPNRENLSPADEERLRYLYGNSDEEYDDQDNYEERIQYMGG